MTPRAWALVIACSVVGGFAIWLVYATGSTEHSARTPTLAPGAHAPVAAAEARPAATVDPSITSTPSSTSATTVGAKLPAPAPPSAREEREAALSDLRASGFAEEEWDARAIALFGVLGAPLVTKSVEGCFVAGCGATFTFASEAEYRARLDQFVHSDGYLAWTGGKHLTSPERQPDGRVVIGVVLYRPD